jgi:hypothetical protein
MTYKSKIVIEALLKIIQTLVEDRFWGQITIKFKDGEPIVINQEQQIKLIK